MKKEMWKWGAASFATVTLIVTVIVLFYKNGKGGRV